MALIPQQLIESSLQNSFQVSIVVTDDRLDVGLKVSFQG
jgi:TFIIF-interacting CTD phosphatase-like protein